MRTDQRLGCHDVASHGHRPTERQLGVAFSRPTLRPDARGASLSPRCVLPIREKEPRRGGWRRRGKVRGATLLLESPLPIQSIDGLSVPEL